MESIPGPFITVVSVDDGLQEANNLTVITPYQETHDSLLMPTSRLSVVHEESEDIFCEDERDEQLESRNFTDAKNGGSAYVTVLALGKRLEGQKRSVINLCSDEDVTAPHVVAILSKAEKSPAQKRIKTSSVVEIGSPVAESLTAAQPLPEVVENVVIYKLPGERLGFGLRFDGGVTHPGDTVKGLFIQSCAENSPAARTKASWGSLVEGDEILEIEEVPVSTLSKMSCIQLLKDASVVVNLKVRHFYSPRNSPLTDIDDDILGGDDNCALNTNIHSQRLRHQAFAWLNADVCSVDQQGEDYAERINASIEQEEDEEENLNLCHDRIQINNLNAGKSTISSENRSSKNEDDHVCLEVKQLSCKAEERLIKTGDASLAEAASCASDGIFTEKPAQPVQPHEHLKPALRHVPSNNMSRQMKDGKFANTEREEVQAENKCETPDFKHVRLELGQAGGNASQVRNVVPVAPPRKSKAENYACQLKPAEALTAVKIKPPMGFTDEDTAVSNSVTQSVLQLTGTDQNASLASSLPQEAKVYTNLLEHGTSNAICDTKGHSSHTRAESVISGCESDETGSTRSTVVSRLSMLSMLSINNLSEVCNKRTEIPFGQYAEGIEDITSPVFATEDCTDEEIPLAPPPYFQDVNNNNGSYNHNLTENYIGGNKGSFCPTASTGNEKPEMHGPSASFIPVPRHRDSLSPSTDHHRPMSDDFNQVMDPKLERNKIIPNGNLPPNSSLPVGITDDYELALLAEELGLGGDDDEDEAEELRKFLLLEEKLNSIHDKRDNCNKSFDSIEPPVAPKRTKDPSLGRIGNRSRSGSRSSSVADSKIPVYCNGNNGEKDRRPSSIPRVFRNPEFAIRRSTSADSLPKSSRRGPVLKGQPRA